MPATETGLKHYQMYVNGEFKDSTSGKLLTVINPSTGEKISTVPSATREETQEAINDAYEAEKTWKFVPAATRGQYLHDVATEVRNQADHLIALLQEEQGKIKSLATTEIMFSADYFDYMAAAARTYEGEILQSDNEHENIMIAKQPIGVAAGILPWNFPFFLIARKMGPALVTGNTIVMKPSSDTPNLALEFAKIVDKVGIPKGVVNFVTGPGSVVGDELSRNKKIGIISLTGSVDSGKRVMAAASTHMAKVSLELGGKAPAIVCSDADLDLAAQAIIDSRIDNNGQLCNNCERIYVQEDVADEFTKKLTAKMAAVKVANPITDKDSGMGPLINQAALDKVDGMVQRAVKAGGKITTGGHKVTIENGFYYEPTVITNVKQDSEIVQDEIFGPVLPIVTYKTLDDAINMANDSDFGLTSSIFTQNLDNAARAANELEDGETYINRFNFEAMNGSHSGWKESGIGGDDGRHGIEEYLNTHVIYLQGHPEKAQG
ncbi:aldehyde dehydrogenase [Levilactobacillus zymae]|uniref:Aldehyde dehydrogenase n=1 Tax=Levilactobacillus zymae TaxID=267363 RepID=A0ABQ0WZP3_9LACO|nr:aldehyde dehydrogenase [Levilactobacillus zymae]KRL06941.1 glycolaldehyde dehydrogenase [Levilactobacillus zymae DSM 19395]QFR62225.1 aldehyde dehydrogenase [Levilactobacillus zymae]GEO73108.1 aldehyde dehydrogenase [Levilactobacillus zymae]